VIQAHKEEIYKSKSQHNYVDYSLTLVSNHVCRLGLLDWLRLSDRLVQIKQAFLLLEMINIHTSNMVEVIGNKHKQEDPLHIAGCIHPENKHHCKELEKQSWLKDAIIP
jgi:hypothetical protein